MADITPALPRSLSPLHSWGPRFEALAPAVLLSETPVAQVVVRTTDPAAMAGLDLPGACAVRHHGEHGETAVWLGPDEWLLYRRGISGHDYLAELTERCSAGTYLMDTSGQRTRLVFGGPHAETVLAHGCAINLAPESFGPDDAAQTLLAQTGVILHRIGGGFALFVRSSFAVYLAEWLIDASVEYLTPTIDLA